MTTSTSRCPLCGSAHSVCGNPAGSGTGVAVDAVLYQPSKEGTRVNSKIERRFVKTDGQWRLFKISPDDPRYADSEPYDENQPNNGRPDVDDAPMSVREAAKQTAADAQQADAERAAGLGPDGETGDDDTKSRTASNKARTTRSGATGRRGSRSTSTDGDSAKTDDAGDTSTKTDEQ